MDESINKYFGEKKNKQMTNIHMKRGTTIVNNLYKCFRMTKI